MFIENQRYAPPDSIVCLACNQGCQSIGVRGVQTPPIFGPVVSTYIWTPPEFAFTV